MGERAKRGVGNKYQLGVAVAAGLIRERVGAEYCSMLQLCSRHYQNAPLRALQ